MSERHPISPEQNLGPKSPEASAEHAPTHHEKEPSHAERQHGNEKHVTEAAKRAHEHAASAKETHVPNHERSHHPVFHGLREKEMAWTRSMTRTRKKLSFASRSFSKIAHNPVVDASSEFVGKTVARPSSMLGGALFAFVGSSLVLWAVRHHGYEYNYLVFFLLFVLGMGVGLVVELLFKAFRKRS